MYMYMKYRVICVCICTYHVICICVCRIICYMYMYTHICHVTHSTHAEYNTQLRSPGYMLQCIHIYNVRWHVICLCMCTCICIHTYVMQHIAHTQNTTGSSADLDVYDVM